MRQNESDTLEAERLELRTTYAQFESERLALETSLEEKSREVIQLRADFDRVTQERDAARQAGTPSAKVGFLEASLSREVTACDCLRKANKSLQDRLSAQPSVVASESVIVTGLADLNHLI